MKNAPLLILSMFTTLLSTNSNAEDHSYTFQPGLISQRFDAEINASQSDFALTPHMMNYVLPVYTTNHLNPMYNIGNSTKKNIETHFQLSVKFPLNSTDIMFQGDKLYGAFTLKAWWQMLDKDDSSPFRETNYTPELMYAMPLTWKVHGGNTGVVLGIQHDSNGQSGELSRSWNRAYAKFLYERGNLVACVKPWYRIPEHKKSSPEDVSGDDNPNITDYLGHGEVNIGYSFNKVKVLTTIGGNLSTSKGNIKLDITTPLAGNLRAYATVFHGYGDSLIDYDHKQTRIGLGITLNDLF
ncbi:phospholipase A [Vibrio barjaei]|uniref:phospholipase A n=1 Tax=Vibrio barjaei TaxID=1676683 RepID=UPI0022835035|nr:phospholipase A [Vibrio barjaei]MCY9874599.1 phospholipase A [Vibrio barjaei]